MSLTKPNFYFGFWILDFGLKDDCSFTISSGSDRCCENSGQFVGFFLKIFYLLLGEQSRLQYHLQLIDSFVSLFLTDTELGQEFRFGTTAVDPKGWTA